MLSVKLQKSRFVFTAKHLQEYLYISHDILTKQKLSLITSEREKLSTILQKRCSNSWIILNKWNILKHQSELEHPFQSFEKKELESEVQNKITKLVSGKWLLLEIIKRNITTPMKVERIIRTWPSPFYYENWMTLVESLV